MLPLSFVYSKLRPKSFEAIKGKQFIVLFPESRRSEKILFMKNSRMKFQNILD